MRRPVWLSVGAHIARRRPVRRLSRRLTVPPRAPSYLERRSGSSASDRSRFGQAPRRQPAVLNRTVQRAGSTASTSRPAFSHADDWTWPPSTSFAHQERCFDADTGSSPTSASISSNVMVTGPSLERQRCRNSGSYFATRTRYVARPESSPQTTGTRRLWFCSSAVWAASRSLGQC